MRTVDIDSIVDRLDLDALAARIDVDAVLDRVDLTSVAKERLDIDAVMRTVDIDSIVDRLDLVALANEVIAAIDLPAIIRQSSGSLASETVRNVRIQSIEADRAVERVIDRFRPHRRLRSDGQQPGSAAT
jgi:predicted RNase H-like nuclease